MIAMALAEAPHRNLYRVGDVAIQKRQVRRAIHDLGHGGVCQPNCSKISSDFGIILPIGLTKLLFEVALLAEHDSVMHDGKEGN